MLKQFLEGLTSEAPVTQGHSRSLFEALVQGQLNDIEIAALLIGLKARGETVAVLAGAVQARRAAATPFETPVGIFGDSCGTGGDGLQTVNISTAVAIVAAELGLPMVKHGNRSVSSLCGSADLLERLGIPLDLSPARARRCLDQAGLCFLFAPHYHPGLRNAMNVRRTLKTRTLFNLLGPLLNPSAPPVQMVGVYDPSWCAPLAETLGSLGCTAALVVHGCGLDEIALHGPTEAVLWKDGAPRSLTITPADAGIEEYDLHELHGGAPAENALWIEGLLRGQGSAAHKAAVAINTGALLWIADRAESLRDGTQQVLELLTGDRAWQRLQSWVKVSVSVDGPATAPPE
jgi:anthranilate phosphoribosyltransferase